MFNPPRPPAALEPAPAPAPQGPFNWFWSLCDQLYHPRAAEQDEPALRGPSFDGNTVVDDPRKEGEDRRNNNVPRTFGTFPQAQAGINQLLLDEFPKYFGAALVGVVLELGVPRGGSGRQDSSGIEGADPQGGEKRWQMGTGDL